MSRVGGAVRVGLAALVAGGLLAAAATTTGSRQLAAPAGRTELPAVSDVALTDAQLVCPGPERIGAPGLRDVTGTVRVAAASAPAGVLARVLEPLPAGTGRLSLGPVQPGKPAATSTERGRVVTGRIGAATAYAGQGRDGMAPGLAATQSWLRGGDDDRGLAMTSCAAPAPDLWLVGGGAGASRTERLVLVNPGANTITVGFTVLSAKGTVDGAGHGVSIPPRSRAVVALDRLAPDVPAPVVHVVASGGRVAGVLSDAWIDGATGLGSDDAAPAAPPATELVVPGVDKVGDATLRVANPTDVEALVQVRVLTTAGPVQPDALRVLRVPAGSSTDVPLQVPDGATGLHLVADHPVVAGVWVQRRVATGADRMGDFGWTPAMPAVRRMAGAVLAGVVPSDSTARLLLAAGSVPATVSVTTVSGADSATQVVPLRPDTAAALDVTGAEQAWLTVASGAVHAALSVSGSADRVPYLSIVPLRDSPVTALSVPVRQLGN